MILFEESTLYEKENLSWGYKAQVQKLTPPFISYVILDSHLLSGDGHPWSWLSNGIPGAGQVRWINSPCNNDQCETLLYLRFCFSTSYKQKYTNSQQPCSSTFFGCDLYSTPPRPPNFWSVCVIQDTDITESNRQGHVKGNQVTKARRIRRNCKHEDSLSVLAVRTEGATWLAGFSQSDWGTALCPCRALYLTSNRIWRPSLSAVFSPFLLSVTPCPVVCSPPGSSAHGIFFRQEYWSGLSFPSPGDLQPRDWTRVSWFGRRILYHQAIWEAPW